VLATDKEVSSLLRQASRFHRRVEREQHLAAEWTQDGREWDVSYIAAVPVVETTRAGGGRRAELMHAQRNDTHHFSVSTNLEIRQQQER